jgi:hypothetical protein
MVRKRLLRPISLPEDTMKEFLFLALQTAAVAVTVLSAVCPVSCRATDEGLQILHGDYTAPVIESYAVRNDTTVELVFSKKVKIPGAVISVPQNQGRNDAVPLPAEPSLMPESAPASVSYENDGKTAAVVSPKALETGKKYELYGEAEDEAGNTLTFCLPFTGFNGEVPGLLITEVHPVYTAGTRDGVKVYKNEFVELYAETAGCLSGLAVISANDGNKSMYELPPVKVARGDVIVVHMRTKGDGCISETGSDLSLSKALYSCSTARDVWSSYEGASLGDRQDVVMLKNMSSGGILDAVLYAPAGTAAWKNDAVKAAAEAAAEAGVWNGSAPSDAAVSDGLTGSRTLERTRVSAAGQNAGDWHVTKSGGETPGTAVVQ